MYKKIPVPRDGSSFLRYGFCTRYPFVQNITKKESADLRVSYLIHQECIQTNIQKHGNAYWAALQTRRALFNETSHFGSYTNGIWLVTTERCTGKVGTER